MLLSKAKQTKHVVLEQSTLQKHVCWTEHNNNTLCLSRALYNNNMFLEEKKPSKNVVFEHVIVLNICVFRIRASQQL